MLLASYLLVITSCSDVGERAYCLESRGHSFIDVSNFEPVFDENRTVFKVDGVTSIPLEHARAIAIVNMLGSLNAHISTAPSNDKPTRRPRDSDLYSSSDVSDDHINQQDHGDLSTSMSHQHVMFGPEKRRQFVSPSLSREELDVRSPSYNSSGCSTPTPAFPISIVAKALASRLSFWNRSPEHLLNSPALEVHSSDMVDSLERRMANGEAATDVLHSIISSAAPPPSTVEEKHSELEEKIVKETTKEFVKGGMFFSYRFGTNAHHFYTSSSIMPF